MGSGKNLTEYEKGKIDQLKKLNWSERSIAAEIGRSKTAVHKYLSNKESDLPKSTLGRPKKIGPRTTKRVCELLAKKKKSLRSVKKTLSLDVSPSSLLNLVRSHSTLKFVKFKGKPGLKPNHIQKRFDFALEHVTWTSEWDRVVFSDEKKFNLDGPDGCHAFWTDLQDSPEIFSKRVQGGGSVMVWAGFSKEGKTEIKFISTRMKSADYVRLLQDALIPFGDLTFQGNYTFQQDNAPCYRARSTINWLNEREISVMDWPALSPDLNPIENLWGTLVRKVYEGGRQYDTKEQLKAAIIASWDQINAVELNNLVCSMPRRMTEVLKVKGKSINY